MKKIIKVLPLICMVFLLVFCEEHKPNKPPIIVIVASPASGRAPLTVNFFSAAQDPEGKTLTYAWNFGDGTGSSTQQNPVYTYTSYGDYTATCTVTDSGHPPLSASATVAIEVLADTPTLSSVSPISAVMHMPSFTLTVEGSDFQNGAQIVFNGTPMSTVYINSNKLTCTITPEDTLIQDSLELQQNISYVPDIAVAFNVSVINPPPSGGESQQLDFMVHSNYSFEDPVQLPNGSDFYQAISMVIRSDGQLNAIYQSGESYTYPFGKYVRHIVSNDNGDTWTSDHQIISDLYPFDDSPYDLTRLYYAIAAGLDNKLYIIYGGPPLSPPTKKNDIYLATFDPATGWTQSCLTSENGGLCGIYNPTLHMCGDELYLYFTGLMLKDYGSYYHVGFLMNPITIQPWVMPQNITDPDIRIGVFTSDPYNRLHFVIYENSSLEHLSATKDSSYWSLSEKHLISYPDGSYPQISLVSDPNGVLYAFWVCPEQEGTTLSFSRSDYGGVYWTKKKVISGAGLYFKVSAAVDSAGNVIVVFSKEDYGEEKVYFHRSIDHGLNWSAPKKVADSNGNSGVQALSIDNTGRLHVVWNSVPDGYNYYSRSRINEH